MKSEISVFWKKYFLLFFGTSELFILQHCLSCPTPDLVLDMPHIRWIIHPRWIWPSTGEIKEVVHRTCQVLVAVAIFDEEGVGLETKGWRFSKHQPWTSKLIFSSYSSVDISNSVRAQERKIMEKVNLPCNCLIKKHLCFHGIDR